MTYSAHFRNLFLKKDCEEEYRNGNDTGIELRPVPGGTAVTKP